MKTKYTIAAIAAVVVIVIAALGAYWYLYVPTTQPKKVRVAFVHEQTSGDVFFAAAYKGVQEAVKTVDFEYSISDSVAVADAERVFRDYAERGFDVIFAHAFAYGDAVLAAANDYPKTIFMHCEGFKTTSNLAVYDWKPHEPCYLMGMLAGALSKSNKVAVVGLVPVPTNIREAEAFYLGAKEVNPNVKVGIIYTGSWFDPAKEEESVTAFIDAGADVIYQMGVGGFKKCEENGVLVMGSMVDTYELAPSVHVTSFEWNLASLIVKIVKDVQAGTWKTGVYKWGMAEGVHYLTPYHDMESKIPQSVKDMIAKKTEEIKKGTFVVPEIVEITHESEL